MRRSMNPAIDWMTVFEIRVECRAELAVAPGRLFTSLRLAVVEVHGNS